ncbi:MAG: aspartate carbamoyltransferase regulatory subunit [Ignavibacteriales bacterium]|nr:aspartate carbamoyltransferase regulatory subunit [Ignavibacteriales bacterium]
MKELKVDAIENGTVIDHIPAGRAFKIIEILKLADNIPVMVGTQLPSKKFGRKDIIKIENTEFTEDQLNIITLLAPSATYVTIRNFEAVKKSDARIPKIIKGLVTCPNTICITNHEHMQTKFGVESEEPVTVRCGYCERVFTIDDINKFMQPIKEE